jgi:flagellar motility protein MotE (MotC chaperone)
MTRPLEIAALSLGGLSFFSVAFLGFAVSSGVPLNRMAVIGPLFATDEEPTEEPEDPEDEFQSELEVIQSNRGVLAAYQIPPPFSGEELQDLAQELRNTRLRQTQRDLGLDDREQQITEREEAVFTQLAALERMRDVLENEADALAVRSQEVARDEAAEVERNLSAWRKRADFFKGASPKKVVSRLLEYEPQEAATILQLLDPKTANGLLAALPEDRWKEYGDAYAEAAPLTTD